MKFVILFWTVSIVSIQASKYDSFVHPLSDEFIDLVNEKATTWKAGRNFPNEKSEKDLKRLLGTFIEPKDPNRPTLVHDISADFVFPENFDAREAWPSCPTIGEIRDQGDCGACWATAPVEIMSDRMCTLSNGTIHFRYSTEDLLSCCEDCEGCIGGFLDSAFQYWKNSGIVSGGPYNSSQGCSPYLIPPYQPDMGRSKPTYEGKDGDTPTPACQKTCQPEYDIAYEDDLHYGIRYYGMESEDDARYELITRGPIVSAFLVYEDFYSYKSGIYVHEHGSYDGGHAIRILGYGVENGTKYWLCANSWNTDWGDNGYFKILRGVDECNIEANLLAGIPKFT